MRDYREEEARRVAFLRAHLRDAGARGFVFGNSGGKDSALTGILCRRACEDVLSVAMPCGVSRNYAEDLRDAALLCAAFDIPSVTVDLAGVKTALSEALVPAGPLSDDSAKNIHPRLRMTTLYAIAQTRGALVAGTGNACEYYMGYFTKWGDGAYDVNPIADLTVSEIYDFLRYLGAPPSILQKVPSGGLFEGQTDEEEMGVTYVDIERALQGGDAVGAEAHARMERAHKSTAHKRRLPFCYGEREG